MSLHVNPGGQIICPVHHACDICHSMSSAAKGRVSASSRFTAARHLRSGLLRFDVPLGPMKLDVVTRSSVTEAETGPRGHGGRHNGRFSLDSWRSAFRFHPSFLSMALGTWWSSLNCVRLFWGEGEGRAFFMFSYEGEGGVR